MSLAQITDEINAADAGLEALVALLSQAQGTIPPAGIAHLLRPLHLSIRRVAEALTDAA